MAFINPLIIRSQMAFINPLIVPFAIRFINRAHKPRFINPVHKSYIYLAPFSLDTYNDRLDKVPLSR